MEARRKQEVPFTFRLWIILWLNRDVSKLRSYQECNSVEMPLFGVIRGEHSLVMVHHNGHITICRDVTVTFDSAASCHSQS